MGDELGRGSRESNVERRAKKERYMGPTRDDGMGRENRRVTREEWRGESVGEE